MTAEFQSLLGRVNEHGRTILFVTAHIDLADAMTNRERNRALAATLRRNGFGMVAVKGILTEHNSLDTVEFLVAHCTGEALIEPLVRDVLVCFDQHCVVWRRAGSATFFVGDTSDTRRLCEGPLTSESLSWICATLMGGSRCLIQDVTKLGGFAAALAEQALRLPETAH